MNTNTLAYSANAYTGPKLD